LQKRYGNYKGSGINVNGTYVPGQKPKTNWQMFESNTYERMTTDMNGVNTKDMGYDLLFSDKTRQLIDVDEDKSTYRVYLGDQFMNAVRQLKKCPVKRVRLCLNSEPEMYKCNQMKKTFDGKNIKPGLLCLKAFDPSECMHRIRDNTADVTMLDAADVYMAGRYYGLVPIAAEEYVTDDTFFAVAVAKKKDPDTTMLNLRAKRACMGGIGTEAGWTLPVQTILSTYQAYRGRFFREKCDVIKLIGEFFSTSCVPGALSSAYNGKLQNPRMLCELCGGDSGGDFCAKNMDEPYFGTTGAFKCLVEKGEVAFTSHRAVIDNVDMRNKENWARSLRADEFELLCEDGTRMPVGEYKKCNLGKVRGRALITSRRRPVRDRDIFWNVLNLGQMYFGTGSQSEFNMFRSMPVAYADLIFSDSTMKLKKVPVDKQDYRDFLNRTLYLPRIQQMDLTTCGTCKTFPSCHLTLLNIILAGLIAAYVLN
jgi:melanoma-associated antigen p97